MNDVSEASCIKESKYGLVLNVVHHGTHPRGRVLMRQKIILREPKVKDRIIIKIREKIAKECSAQCKKHFPRVLDVVADLH